MLVANIAPFVAMPFATSSFLFLVVRPGAPSSILAPSKDLHALASRPFNLVAMDDVGQTPQRCITVRSPIQILTDSWRVEGAKPAIERL